MKYKPRGRSYFMFHGSLTGRILWRDSLKLFINSTWNCRKTFPDGLSIILLGFLLAAKYPMKGRWQSNEDIYNSNEGKLGKVGKRKLKAKWVSALGKILHTIFTFTAFEDMSNVCAVQQTPPGEQSVKLSLSRTDKVSKVVCSWTQATLLWFHLRGQSRWLTRLIRLWI